MCHTKFFCRLALCLMISSISYHAYTAEKPDNNSKGEKDKKAPKRPSAQSSKATTFPEAIDEGKQRLAEMDYAGAEKSFEKAQKLAKTTQEKGQALSGLAGAQHNMGEHKDAVATLLEALRYQPEKENPGQQAETRKKFSGEVLNEAYRISAKVMEDWKLTHRICLRALEIPEFDLAQNLDWHKRNLGAYGIELDSKSVDLWHAKALALHGLTPRDQFWLNKDTGGCYSGMAWRKGQDVALYERAREYFNLALNVPDYKFSRNDLAEVYNAIGGTYNWSKQYADGRASYARTLALSPAPAIQYIFSANMGVGWSYRGEGNKAEARRCFAEALRIADEKHNETWRNESAKALEGL